MQRVLLFLVTNFAILIVLSIAMQVLGIDDMLAASIRVLIPRESWPSLPYLGLAAPFIPGDLQIHGQTRHGCPDHRTAKQRHRTLD